MKTIIKTKFKRDRAKAGPRRIFPGRFDVDAPLPEQDGTGGLSLSPMLLILGGVALFFVTRG